MNFLKTTIETETSEMIKGNESDFADIVFEILSKKEFKFLVSINIYINIISVLAIIRIIDLIGRVIINLKTTIEN